MSFAVKLLFSYILDQLNVALLSIRYFKSFKNIKSLTITNRVYRTVEWSFE